MTYEARTNGGPWRPVFPMRGESIDEVFAQLGPGAEVRQAQEAASGADLWARVEALEGRVSQLEAVREMDTDNTCACGNLNGYGVAKVAGRYLCVACGRERKTW